MTGRSGVADDEPDYHGDDQQHAERDQQFDPMVNQEFGRVANRQLGRVVAMHQATASASVAGTGRGPAGGRLARYLASSRRAVPGW